MKVTKGKWQTRTWYELLFDDGEGGGFGFPCDADGNVEELNPAAAENLKWCQAHRDRFVHIGVEEFHQEWKDPDQGTCSCGETFDLIDEYYGACQCPKCHRWYNLFGQSLRPPEDWEIDPSEEEW